MIKAQTQNSSRCLRLTNVSLPRGEVQSQLLFTKPKEALLLSGQGVCVWGGVFIDFLGREGKRFSLPWRAANALSLLSRLFVLQRAPHPGAAAAAAVIKGN